MTSRASLIQDFGPSDPKYGFLFQFRSPPQHLYTQSASPDLGVLEKLPSRGLAIVGTRGMSGRSQALIRKVVRDLSGQDIVIVSGFARGVDRAAHEAALDYGLPTVAIIGSGFHCLYPSDHHDLASRILKSGGILMSEHPPNTPARPFQFLKRNRLIAHWSNAVWIVQAADRSGAINTAAWANDAQIPVYATPSFPGDPDFSGNQKLLESSKAWPLWGAQSLGSQWLEFATLKSSSETLARPPHRALPTDDSSQLYRWIVAQFHSGAPLTVVSALEWALESHGSRERFFAALENLQSLGHLRPGPLNTLIPEDFEGGTQRGP